MKLIIINGPCGVGKSTVARKLHETLPLSFLLDIDAQRRFISRHIEMAPESLSLVNAVALGITEACLREGRDVIVEKKIENTQFLDDLIALGKKHGAETYEFILWAPKEVVMKRAADRGYRPGGSFTPEKCERFWHQIDDLKDRRPEAKVIDAGRLDSDGVLEAVKKTALI
jgi:predicted kinase